MSSKYHRIIKACATCGCGQSPGGMSGPGAAAAPVKCDRCGATGASEVAPDGKQVCPHCAAKEAKATQRLVTKKLNRIANANS